MKIQIAPLKPGGDRAPRGLRQLFPRFEDTDPLMLVWTVVYDHEDCAECRKHVDTAIIHARVTGSLGCHAETRGTDNITHGARVDRAPVKIRSY